MSRATHDIIVIAGQTAGGKSALALELAERTPVEIVSADSVQVYRGFDVGSAKPTREEQARTRHHLIDIVDPDEAIDAASFAKRADDAIAAAQERGSLPVVVGGTGLWMRALLMGLVDLPPVDVALRQSLESEAQNIGDAAMHTRLGGVDPASAENIHPNDRLRILRALEVHSQTGKTLSSLRAAHALGEPRYRFFMVSIEESSEVLRPRLAARTNAMLAAGWIDEVRGLLQRWPDTTRAFGSVGYREICAHLRNDLSAADLAITIERETWRYAKRQRTWFRGERYVHIRDTLEACRTAISAAISSPLQ